VALPLEQPLAVDKPVGLLIAEIEKIEAVTLGDALKLLVGISDGVRVGVAFAEVVALPVPIGETEG